jgi:hypothetical protein
MSSTPGDLICRFEHVTKLEKARAEDIEDWPTYQDIFWEYQINDELSSTKKRKRKGEPDGYDKELPKPQYYPPTNIFLSLVPPPIPLHIPIHTSLTKGFTREDIDVLLDEGIVPSAADDVVAHRKQL